MSAVLDPGMRAVSIAVTATSGNGGFISPGDHVDLIVTHHIKDTPSNDSVVSETFVHDVRIVAVDQMLDNPDNKAILAKTVTVEVTPRQAEQISVATEMGKISVALRGIATVDPATGAAVPGQGTTLNGNYTRDTDISSALNRDTVSPHIRIIRGDQTENLQLY
jgi:pilus assembly protein CpaB